MAVTVPTGAEHTALAGTVDSLTDRLGTTEKGHDALGKSVGSLADRLGTAEQGQSELGSTVEALDKRLRAAENVIDQRVRPTPHILRPEDFGAVAGKDCSAAFTKMLQAVDQGLQPDAAGGIPVARHTIELGPGPYILSKPWMVPTPGRAQGLVVRGIGKRSSEIVWTGEGPLLTNRDRWMGVRWENLSFRSTNAKGSFLYSSSTGANQDWHFTSCEWRGTWAYGIGLDGPETSNTNSEWRFSGCHINGSYTTAFLWSGMTPASKQQDQFLNFWITDCKVEYDSGDAFRFDRGGHVTVTGGSFIIKGVRPDGAPSRFFNLPIVGHYDSVQHLNVRGVRFELRHATDQVIFSKWSGGHISFSDCSDTALGFQAHSKTLIAHDYDLTAGGGPQVRYTQCDLVGQHRFRVGSASTGRASVVYDQCSRKNNRTLASFLQVVGQGSLPAESDLTVSHRDDGDGITS
ncbi:hypothetical protein ABZ605_27905 [Streptomyces sp. NPDC012765]|uniref:hypothetical protein n=1 Tax=Streptomyces sp. NPDC012765 TaxID=3155249 RepID=UPI0033C7B4A4